LILNKKFSKAGTPQPAFLFIEVILPLKVSKQKILSGAKAPKAL